MKYEILEGKKLTEYQKKVLYMISVSGDENYIIEVFYVNRIKKKYVITNGNDDFEDLTESTMNILRQFDFLHSKILSSSEIIIRTKYFIPERFRVDVFLACI